MRDYLNDVEIVGATMVYREGDQCRWSLDWLYANCDRVCILLDNYNYETLGIVLDYRDRYPGRTHIGYSEEPYRENKNEISGQVKKRFKNRQQYIRESMIRELRKMHDEKPIDLLIWPDSDETFIDEFPKYLKQFWEDKNVEYMMLGFIEAYDSMDQIVTQKMAPHGRVYKYKPEMTALPYAMRTIYHPFELKRPWKVRNLVVHMCNYTPEYRERRKFFANRDMMEEGERLLWKLPKDVRQMTVEEIADYQFGYRGAPPKYAPIKLTDYLINK